MFSVKLCIFLHKLQNKYQFVKFAALADLLWGRRGLGRRGPASCRGPAACAYCGGAFAGVARRDEEDGADPMSEASARDKSGAGGDSGGGGATGRGRGGRLKDAGAAGLDELLLGPDPDDPRLTERLGGFGGTVAR